MRIAVLLLAAVLPLQLACDIDTLAGNGGRYQDDFEYTYDLNPGAKVSLETFNGSVEVLSWEKREIRITGTKYAPDERDLRDIRIEIKNSPDSVRIRAIRPPHRPGNMGAKFFLRVPREIDLERINTSNGSIRVEDIRGSGRLESSNGSIRVSRFEGSLAARTSNAAIECFGVEGGAQLRTTNGAIRVEDAGVSLDAETSNGPIHLVGFQSPASETVRLQTSNGVIEAAIDRLGSGGLRAVTSNAAITLRLPAGAGAQLRASTSNGPVSAAFDVSGQVGKHSIDGAINGGGPLVYLTTSNGAIRIEKR
ncbi:MAG: hypothetical protein ACM3ZB_11880 [bacterium]|jgi:hypothetical protein